ncbi:MAG: helix-turn-helix domain-containing protein [Candidatus Altiarchaeota archaeon]|nr:helix-turn-helix domain-containing protein [Candidatus Altiarchaeota archaeon]
MNAASQLEKTIAGEIAIADDPGKSIQKWREVFQLNQSELARAMDVSPSVVSDYESGRRKSPGTHFIKGLVEALVREDIGKGGEVLNRFTIPTRHDAILSMREFARPVPASKLLTEADAQLIGRTPVRSMELKGFTVIDSLKAIIELSEETMRDIYGSTTERALIFTKVHSGRSPLIAIKVTKPKPRLIILHGLKPSKADRLAVKIADAEGIPLAVSITRNEQKLIENLEQLR